MTRRWPAPRPITRPILVVALLVFVFLSRRHAAVTDDRTRFDHRVATVHAIVDGNTIDVDVDGSSTRVRLLGIDAASSAAAYMNARAGGKQVTLRLDEVAATRDAAGALLAYVYLDGAELLNQSMIRDGVAYADRAGDCDLAASFATEENGARASKRGLWKTITADQMPAWRRAWLREHHLE